jgi:hypothetical protein
MEQQNRCLLGDQSTPKHSWPSSESPLKWWSFLFQDGMEDTNSHPSFQQISVEIYFHLEAYQAVWTHFRHLSLLIIRASNFRNLLQETKEASDKIAL